MSAEAGHFALILAFSVAVAQFLIGAIANDGVRRVMARTAYANFALMVIAFACLLWGFVQSDFSLALVQANSHIAKPFIYKIAAVWGNHEGSLLLWTLILAAYASAFARFEQKTSEAFYRRVLMVQAAIIVSFSAFMLFTSNPFARLLPAPFEGQGLNPILQDAALAAHPPLLYLGYVGFSICFAQALAVLLGRGTERDWARIMRPWVLVAWVFLVLGIALGSFWAYYELGWGGFWFWDPVENASLMPWLAATALLHSLMAADKRNIFVGWVLLLAILTFCLSLSGTFLVRSGVLTSVHAFANDPERGLFILLILAGFALWGLVLYARFAPKGAVADYALISRESTLLMQNIFLSVATATVLLGTIYPLVLDALGVGKISVGAPYFNTVFAPLLIPSLALAPFAPLIGWGQGDARAAARRLAAAVPAVGVAITAIVYWRDTPPLALAVMAAALWMVFASAHAWRQKITRMGWAGLSAPAHLAHIGVGVMVFAAITATVWRSETIVAATTGDVVRVAHYQLRFDGVQTHEGANYQSEIGQLVVLNTTQILKPERRFYDAEGSTTTEAALVHGLDGTLYAVIGERVNGQQVLRLWYHPFVNFIWVGCILMALGGMAALLKQMRRA